MGHKNSVAIVAEPSTSQSKIRDCSRNRVLKPAFKMTMFQKIIFWTLLTTFLASVFMLGQNFYYKKRVASIIHGKSIVINGGLTANLTTILEQQNLTLKYQEKIVSVDAKELKTWVESYIRNYTGKQELRVNAISVTAYLKGVSKKINTTPVNAKLVINNNSVSEFEPPQPGLALNISTSVSRITASLARGNYKEGVELIVDERQPEITLDKINDLGINTLLARGESDFAGSPKFRVHNIGVGSKKFTGILIKPGEGFSFNKFLGDVDAFSGYLPELVIKNGTLIPEYGGGLCQVSTTLFRAVTLAGLPILERFPHSLPVRYYNPQGFDATIYPGVSDLRFKNDTPAHILIQSKIIGSKIYFEIYGTDDGRKITLDGPRQYDIKSNGALKAELARTVVYPDGTEKKDVFQSSYKAPGSFPIIRNPLE